MKVIFLDFDGVLNSEASFRYEIRRKRIGVEHTLSVVACSNLQYILEQDSGVKLVISSTWRAIYTPTEIQNILNSYGVHGARIVGFTPRTISGDRAHEVNLYLEDHANITKFVVIDDDPQVLAIKDPRGHIFMTTNDDGLLLKQAKQIAKLFREHDPKAAAEVKDA